jgi:hypothetical protein
MGRSEEVLLVIPVLRQSVREVLPSFRALEERGRPYVSGVERYLQAGQILRAAHTILDEQLIIVSIGVRGIVLKYTVQTLLRIRKTLILDVLYDDLEKMIDSRAVFPF